MKGNLKQYCKDISLLLKKAPSITPPSDQQSKFDMTYDLLAKADALCASMLGK